MIKSRWAVEHNSLFPKKCVESNNVLEKSLKKRRFFDR
jgi:hypothetical protein